MNETYNIHDINNKLTIEREEITTALSKERDLTKIDYFTTKLKDIAEKLNELEAKKDYLNKYYDKYLPSQNIDKSKIKKDDFHNLLVERLNENISKKDFDKAQDIIEDIKSFNDFFENKENLYTENNNEKDIFIFQLENSDFNIKITSENKKKLLENIIMLKNYTEINDKIYIIKNEYYFIYLLEKLNTLLSEDAYLFLDEKIENIINKCDLSYLFIMNGLRYFREVNEFNCDEYLDSFFKFIEKENPLNVYIKFLDSSKTSDESINRIIDKLKEPTKMSYKNFKKEMDKQL